MTFRFFLQKNSMVDLGEGSTYDSVRKPAPKNSALHWS